MRRRLITLGVATAGPLLLFTGQQSTGPAGSAPAFDQPHRPQFHYTPAANWMNDPNGLIHHQGELIEPFDSACDERLAEDRDRLAARFAQCVLAAHSRIGSRWLQLWLQLTPFAPVCQRPSAFEPGRSRRLRNRGER